MGPIPKGTFLTKGVGRHREKLDFFRAGAAFRGNRRVQSGARQIDFPAQLQTDQPQEGLKYLTPGQIVFAVMSDNATNEPHRLIASSVGVGACPAILRNTAICRSTQLRRDRSEGRATTPRIWRR